VVAALERRGRPGSQVALVVDNVERSGCAGDLLWPRVVDRLSARGTWCSRDGACPRSDWPDTWPAGAGCSSIRSISPSILTSWPGWTSRG
jgi:hypothetical protein